MTAFIFYHDKIIPDCDRDVIGITIDCFDYFAIKRAAMGDLSTLARKNCALISIQLLFLFGLQVSGLSFIGFSHRAPTLASSAE